jgi:NADH-quinone oxidoreductase subunit M
MEQNVLTYMIFIPLAGAVAVLLLPSKGYNLIRWVSAAATVPPLLMGCWLYANFDTSQTGFQFVQKLPWIPAYNIQYFVFP